MRPWSAIRDEVASPRPVLHMSAIAPQLRPSPATPQSPRSRVVIVDAKRPPPITVNAVPGSPAAAAVTPAPPEPPQVESPRAPSVIDLSFREHGNGASPSPRGLAVARAAAGRSGSSKALPTVPHGSEPSARVPSVFGVGVSSFEAELAARTPRHVPTAVQAAASGASEAAADAQRAAARALAVEAQFEAMIAQQEDMLAQRAAQRDADDAKAHAAAAHAAAAAKGDTGAPAPSAPRELPPLVALRLVVAGGRSAADEELSAALRGAASSSASAAISAALSAAAAAEAANEAAAVEQRGKACCRRHAESRAHALVRLLDDKLGTAMTAVAAREAELRRAHAAHVDRLESNFRWHAADLYGQLRDARARLVVVVQRKEMAASSRREVEALRLDAEALREENDTLRTQLDGAHRALRARESGRARRERNCDDRSSFESARRGSVGGQLAGGSFRSDGAAGESFKRHAAPDNFKRYAAGDSFKKYADGLIIHEPPETYVPSIVPFPPPSAPTPLAPGALPAGAPRRITTPTVVVGAARQRAPAAHAAAPRDGDSPSPGPGAHASEDSAVSDLVAAVRAARGAHQAAAEAPAAIAARAQRASFGADGAPSTTARTTPWRGSSGGELPLPPPRVPPLAGADAGGEQAELDLDALFGAAALDEQSQLGAGADGAPRTSPSSTALAPRSAWNTIDTSTTVRLVSGAAVAAVGGQQRRVSLRGDGAAAATPSGANARPSPFGEAQPRRGARAADGARRQPGAPTPRMGAAERDAELLAELRAKAEGAAAQALEHKAARAALSAELRGARSLEAQTQQALKSTAENLVRTSEQLRQTRDAHAAANAKLRAAETAAAERERWFQDELAQRVDALAGSAIDRAHSLDAELTELRAGFLTVKEAIGERLKLASAALNDALELDQTLASELACPACLADLQRPLLLAPCGHTFCAPCVERWRREAPRGEFACPTCVELADQDAGETAVAFPNLVVEGLNHRVRLKQQEVSRVRNALRRQQAQGEDLIAEISSRMAASADSGTSSALLHGRRRGDVQATT